MYIITHTSKSGKILRRKYYVWAKMVKALKRLYYRKVRAAVTRDGDLIGESRPADQQWYTYA